MLYCIVYDLTSNLRRVIWCPFLPDEDDIDDDDDANSRLLVHVNGCVADMWSLDAVLAKQGGGPGPYEADDITEGQLRITDHTEPISDASFSPDGTALATASLDGQVKFFQVMNLTPQAENKDSIDKFCCSTGVHVGIQRVSSVSSPLAATRRQTRVLLVLPGQPSQPQP